MGSATSPAGRLASIGRRLDRRASACCNRPGDVGEDTGAPVSPDYGPHGNAFNGTVKGVQLAIADAAESADHLVNPEDAIRVALARQ
jgi:hypothetical protein